jgi:hypothetical protein
MFIPLVFASTCALASSAGIDPVDAETAAELVCHEVVPAGNATSDYQVRVARLERKVVVTLTRSDGAAKTERHLVLSGLDEIPTAAPRLAVALADEKPVVETQTVDNVVGEEARKPKKKPGEMHAWLGISTATALSSGFQTRGGVELGLAIGSTSTVFVASGRLIGESFAEPLHAFGTIVSLGLLEDENRKRVDGAFGAGSVGVRQYLTSADLGPFVGGGLGIGYLSVEHPAGARVSGSGVIPYVEVGLDVLRTSMVGGTIALRMDIPTFELEGDAKTRVDAVNVRVDHIRSHVPLLGASAALRF